MSPHFIKENIENKNLIIKYSMLCSLSTFNQNNSKVVYIPPVDPYSTALYRFSLNGNTTNIGTDTSQTLTTNSSTYAQVGGKTSNALLLTTNTNNFYLTNRFNLASEANAQGSLSVFVYPTANTNNTYPSFLYYNCLNTGGVTNNRLSMYMFVNSSGVKTYYLNFGSFNTTYTPQENELAMNQWTHIAITWNVNASQTSGTVNLYLNGNQRFSSSSSTWSTFSSANSTLNSNRLLSTQNYGGNSTPSNVIQTYYTSNFAYWNNKQLNTTEISSIISNFT